MNSASTTSRKPAKSKPASPKSNGAASQTTLLDLIYEIPEKKLILRNISWEFYEQLLAEFEDSNGLHFAYDNGSLEIEMPTPKHELPNRKISDLVLMICFELEIDFINGGSTTLRKKVKAKGLEPDTCFYIQNEAKIRGKMSLNFAKDPPPDLAIEVDVTSPSLDKMPIYAALGVPEVWLYKGERVTFHRLVGDKYEEIERSLALPVLTSEIVTEFLEKGLTESSSAWFRRVREWARQQKT